MKELDKRFEAEVEGIYRGYDAKVDSKTSSAVGDIPRREGGLAKISSIQTNSASDVFEVSIYDMLKNSKDNDGNSFYQSHSESAARGSISLPVGLGSPVHIQTEEWERRLAAHNDAWNRKIAGKLDHSKNNTFLMNVPSVLSLTSGMEDGGIYFHTNKIKKILADHGDELDINSFKNLPRLIADPVIILQSAPNSTNPNSVNVVIKLQGKKNAPVFVNVSLERHEDKSGVYYIAASMYAKDRKTKDGQVVPNFKIFDDWVAAGLLKYVDEDQFKEWKKQNKVSFYLKKENRDGSDIDRVQFPARGLNSRPDGYEIICSLTVE